ncbi:MAG: SDR family oxidoreductase [Chloroflexota bacterium]
MKSALITGGAGFIGSNIAQRLLELGVQIRVLDNLSTGRVENLLDIVDDVDLINGDIRDPDTLDKAMIGMDVVLHQAAIPSVPRSVIDPMISHDAGATGTLQVLLAARRAGVGRVVCASSSSVYGDTPELPKREDMIPNPLSPYAVSKLTGEYYCKVFTRLYGLETVSFRYFNVFGPRQDPTSEYAAVIPRFMQMMARGERPLIHGDGLQSRDFTYVANVVEGNVLAATKPGIGGEVFNLACGERFTLLDLVNEINGILGTSIEPILGEPRPGDIKHSLADISRARSELGFDPVVRFTEGLRATAEWFLDADSTEAAAQ